MPCLFLYFFCFNFSRCLFFIYLPFVYLVNGVLLIARNIHIVAIASIERVAAISALATFLKGVLLLNGSKSNCRKYFIQMFLKFIYNTNILTTFHVSKYFPQIYLIIKEIPSFFSFFFRTKC